MIHHMRMRLFTILSVWMFLSFQLQAQITIEEAYPVDSLLAHRYLASVVLHSENINATLDEPVMTWDAVNGRFEGTTIAYSFTGVVDEEVAESINAVSGQEYSLFDLDSIRDIDHYRDTVEYWLDGLSLPVHISEMPAHQIVVYPNPTSGRIHLSTECNGFKEEFCITVIDLQGRVVKKKSWVQIHWDLPINLSQHPNGVYLIKATRQNATFREMVIKTAP